MELLDPILTTIATGLLAIYCNFPTAYGLFIIGILHQEVRHCIVYYIE